MSVRAHPATPGPAEPDVPEPRCPPLRTDGPAPTMVTLITEKLQNQSLDDLARSSYDARPVSRRPRRPGPVQPRWRVFGLSDGF